MHINPCSKCNREDVISLQNHVDFTTMIFWIECTECYNQGPICYSEETAIKGWNKENPKYRNHELKSGDLVIVIDGNWTGLVGYLDERVNYNSSYVFTVKLLVNSEKPYVEIKEEKLKKIPKSLPSLKTLRLLDTQERLKIIHTLYGGNFLETEEPKKGEWKFGDRVRVVSGFYEGLEGVLSNYNGGSDYQVEFEVPSGMQVVYIDADKLEKIE